MRARSKSTIVGSTYFERNGFISGITCLIFFACGVVVGIFSARTLEEAGASALNQSVLASIEHLVTGARTGTGFLATAWAMGYLHLLVLFLGFSLLGVLIIPILAGVRGFYLSFSIAAFIRAFGFSGWPLAFSFFGLTALITIPCFFILASQGMSSSLALGRSLFGMEKAHFTALYGRAFLLRTVICTLALFLAVALERYISPMLVLWTRSFL